MRLTALEWQPGPSIEQMMLLLLLSCSYQQRERAPFLLVAVRDGERESCFARRWLLLLKDPTKIWQRSRRKSNGPAEYIKGD